MNVRKKLLQKKWFGKRQLLSKMFFLVFMLKFQEKSFRVLFKVGMDGMV